eukprot:554825-Prymnesium_polylepis.1
MAKHASTQAARGSAHAGNVRHRFGSQTICSGGETAMVCDAVHSTAAWCLWHSDEGAFSDHPSCIYQPARPHASAIGKPVTYSHHS